MTKTKPWVVVSLLAATTVFGQESKCRPTKSFDQGHELAQNQMMAAYNAPARIDVRGSWDFFADASFIYWQPSEDNLELGISNSTALGNLNNLGIQGDVINMRFKYKPGFKVGIGMNFDHDNWDGAFEYTYLKGSHSVTSNGSGTYAGGIIPFWGRPNPTLGTNLYNTASATWKPSLQFLDAVLGRAYYEGMQLTVRPFFGARAAWISQKYTVTYTNNGSNGINKTNNGSAAVTDISYITQTTRSWALGPRAGFQGNWMIGEGFRLYGNGAGDILYTKFTKLKRQETHTASTIPSFNESVNQAALGPLRTHLELEMGIGWGSYFDSNNWHIDLLAGYTFQVFFNQNMFRNYYDDQMVGKSNVANGNLYVQGLVVSAKLDF